MSSAAEGLQQTTALVIPIGINKASAGVIAAALTGIEPANAKGLVAYRGNVRELSRTLGIAGIGTATLEKGIGRIPKTEY